MHLNKKKFAFHDASEKMLFAVSLAVTALLFVRSREAEKFVFDYLGFCARRIVPSLFLFLVFSDLVCSSPLFMRICRRIPFYGTEISLLILGALGGFPLGARVCTALYDQGKLRKREAEYLLCFSNNASASFVVGFVGQNLFSCKMIGVKLLALQLFSAICCAAIFKLVLFSRGERGSIKGAERTVKAKSFVKAVTDSGMTMLGICSFIVVFGVVGALAVETFPWFSSPLLRGFFEFSSGISLCAERGGVGALRDCALLLGWSGLCVHCQVVSAVESKLSLKPYFLSKIFQCAVMGLGASLFL